MRYIAHLFLLLVGLGAAFLRWVDLANFTDLETGFPTAGSVWWRYGAIVLLVLLAFVGSFMAARRPKKIEQDGKLLGCLALALALLCGMHNAIAAFLALGMHTLLQGTVPPQGWFVTVNIASVGMALLGLVCAVWLMCVAFSLFAGDYRLPAGGVCLGMLGNFYLYATLIARFADNQSSYYRLDPTVRVFAAAAVIWFTTVLLRAIYYPESAIGHKLYRAGLCCFYLCTCFALPQAVCDFLVGNIAFGDLGQSVLFAGFGILGAGYAARALGKDLL